MKEIWDKKFSSDEFIYGIEPNEFFKNTIEKYPAGRLISFGEGEGRNVVFAAKLGWEVDAVDFSTSGKKKAEKLAAESQVKINYYLSDVAEFSVKKNYYDFAAIIFLHLPQESRVKLFHNAVECLKPGGKLLIEVFEKDQLKYFSGGPKNIELLYSLEDIVDGFIDLNFLTFSKEIVLLNEGNHHSGEGAVIRFLGEKEIIV
jgi:2-polyprenyl-3-methyl-5-hydroxy-6-metoxy-1,4-benzoquinol methylase